MTSSTSNPGTVLLLGGTGKVASRIAPMLQAAKIPSLVASRSGKAPDGFTGARFDWQDKSTWEGALAAGPVKAVFIVAPGMTDPGPIAQEFIDLARVKGATRFVLLSGSPIPEGGPAMGQIHKYMREMGDQGAIEWAVLRPTWFQENFAEQPNHALAIKGENKIYSATGQGRIPWVACHDIAAVAFRALTDVEPPNREFLILGPELFTYGDLAKIFTEVLGREIVHHNLTVDELAQRAQGYGIPKEYASVLAGMDLAIEGGSEDTLNDVVLTMTGREPRKFKDMVEANKSVW